MSLRKRCSRTARVTLANGEPNPLHCQTSPRCDHHWHYDFQIQSRRYRNTTGTADKHTARDIESKERARILEGKHGIRRDSDISFKAFAAEYFTLHAEVSKRATTVARDRRALTGVLNKHFGTYLLREITKFSIEKFKAARLAEGCAPATVNRDLMLLKGMLSKAVEWHRLVASPAADMKALKSGPGRTRILSAVEQVALLDAYDKGRRRNVKPIIQLLMITGARVGEVLALTWRDCEGGYLRFRHTKNGKERRFPITDDIAAALASVPRRGEHVFVSFRSGLPYKKLLTGFRAACKDAGIRDKAVVLHSLRHTALSRMADAGIDLRTIMEISGHQSLAMLERYTHPTEQRKAAALNTFASVTTASQSSHLKAVK